MEPLKPIFKGFVELRYDQGLKLVEIYDNDEYTYAYVDGDLADDVETAEEFANSYGNKLYPTLNDFKNSTFVDVRTVWK